jgi:hypothetical protein
VGGVVAKHERLGHAPLRVALEGGAVAGLGGAVALALFRLALLAEIALLIVRLAPRHSRPARAAIRYVWVALKFPAHPFVGARSLEPGFDAPVVVLGLLTHFACALVWGLLFGVVASCRSRAATVALGLVWGLMGGILDTMFLSRLLGGRSVEYAAVVSVAFLVYGLALARTLLRFERRRGLREWS